MKDPGGGIAGHLANTTDVLYPVGTFPVVEIILLWVLDWAAWNLSSRLYVFFLCLPG